MNELAEVGTLLLILGFTGWLIDGPYRPWAIGVGAAFLGLSYVLKSAKERKQ